jgi:hypothetical protein
VNTAVVTSLEKHPHIKTGKHNGLVILYNNKDVIKDVESGFYVDNFNSSTELEEAEIMLWNKINR